MLNYCPRYTFLLSKPEDLKLLHFRSKIIYLCTLSCCLFRHYSEIIKQWRIPVSVSHLHTKIIIKREHMHGDCTTGGEGDAKDYNFWSGTNLSIRYKIHGEHRAHSECFSRYCISCACSFTVNHGIVYIFFSSSLFWPTKCEIWIHCFSVWHFAWWEFHAKMDLLH